MPLARCGGLVHPSLMGWNCSSGLAMKIGGAGVQSEEFLSALSSFKSDLLPFLLSGRSMRLFDQIVAASTRYHLNVLHRVEHR